MSVVNYGAAEAVVSRGPSPKIWADCPVLQFIADPGKGFYFWDDFKELTFNPDTNATNPGSRWYAYTETTAMANIAWQDDDDGVIMLDNDGSDADVCAIITGDNMNNLFHMPKKGEGKKFWFEARFKVNTITTGDLGVFVGFNEKGEAADVLGGFAGDAAALDTGNDYLGFAVLEGDGDDLTIVHFEAGAGTAQSDTGEITLEADTYIRVGFRLDVDADEIRVYADGVDLGDDAAIDISSANFPSDTDLSILIATVGGTGAANGDNLKLDWVRFAQEY